MKRFIYILIICILALGSNMRAQTYTGVPGKISYQGKLSYIDHGKTKLFKAGTYAVQFSFFDGPVPTGTDQGDLLDTVFVDKNGIYTVTLGGEDHSTQGSLWLNQGPGYWLGVTVLSGPDKKAPLPYALPNHVQFTSVPYADMATGLDPNWYTSCAGLTATGPGYGGSLIGTANSNYGIGVMGEVIGANLSSVYNGWGVVGKAGVWGDQTGNDTTSVGVLGNGFYGVLGFTTEINANGVFGQADSGSGAWGTAGWSHDGVGVYGKSDNGKAGYFNGDVTVTGNLSKSGGSFKIDHPLDPANKYLSHSFVESPDMKNIYDGAATLDARGEAIVALPDWFGALNKDFRYQLTSIGDAAPNLHIGRKIFNNQFTIAGGVPGGEVSWQVTGTRQDAWANAHRIPVEEQKPMTETGRYLHPELFGQPVERAVGFEQSAKMISAKGIDNRIKQMTKKAAENPTPKAGRAKGNPSSGKIGN